MCHRQNSPRKLERRETCCHRPVAFKHIACLPCLDLCQVGWTCHAPSVHCRDSTPKCSCAPVTYCCGESPATLLRDQVLTCFTSSTFKQCIPLLCPALQKGSQVETQSLRSATHSKVAPSSEGLECRRLPLGPATGICLFKTAAHSPPQQHNVCNLSQNCC